MLSKYYTLKISNFFRKYSAILMGLIVTLMVLMKINTHTTHKAKAKQKDLAGKVSKEREVIIRAKYAAEQAVAYSNTSKGMSVTEVNKALAYQKKAAYLHLDKDPDLDMKTLIQRLNEE